jgi:photosystem II stability/assembly factor-like uncharacterized protein
MYYRVTKGVSFAVLVGLATLSLVVGCGSSMDEQPRSSAPTPAKVRALQRVGAAGGWILTDTGLYWTAGPPSTVRAITPGEVSGSDISAAVFIDPQHGWAATQAKRSKSGSEISMFRTSDAGATWSSATVTASAAVSGVSALDFVDTRHGFILGSVESSSNFSFGELYRTDDAGQTWRKLTAPSGGSIRFSTPLLGFLAGGPAGDRLYTTTDGGDSWQERSVALPTAFAGAQPVYGVPTVFDDGSGILPVTLIGGTTAVAFYSTADRGASWVLAATKTVPGALGQGAPVATKIIDADDWVVVAPNGERLFSTADAGRSWRTIAPNGLPGGVEQIDFATLSDGWSLIKSGACSGFKTDCTVAEGGRWTTDGGQTWDVLKKELHQSDDEQP